MAECSFLNINQILAEEEKVMAVTLMDCFNLEGLEYGVIKLVVQDGVFSPKKRGGEGERRGDSPLAGMGGFQDDEDNLLGKREPYHDLDLRSSPSDRVEGEVYDYAFRNHHEHHENENDHWAQESLA